MSEYIFNPDYGITKGINAEIQADNIRDDATYLKLSGGSLSSFLRVPTLYTDSVILNGEVLAGYTENDKKQLDFNTGSIVTLENQTQLLSSTSIGSTISGNCAISGILTNKNVNLLDTLVTHGTKISAIEALDVTQNSNIATTTTKLTGISYTEDTTKISTRLLIEKAYGYGMTTPHLQIINSTPDISLNNIQLSLRVGSNAGVNNPTVQVGDIAFITSSVGLINCGTAYIFSSHCLNPTGLRISTNGGISALHCGSFELNCLTNLKNNDITNIKSSIYSDGSIQNTAFTNAHVATLATSSAQNIRITNIETNTSQLTKTGSILDINNTCTQFRLNQDLNMNYKNITNLSNIIFTGFSGLMQAFISSSSIFTFESILLGDTINGSGFSFKSFKNGLSNLFKINYNTVDFGIKTITNCPTIDDIQDNINTLNNSNISTTNVILVEEFINKIDLVALTTGTSTLQWRNWSSLGNSSTKMVTSTSENGHPGILKLTLPSTPGFANYQVHCGLNNPICWVDVNVIQIIFKIPSGQLGYNFKVSVGIANSNSLSKSAVWTSTNNGYFQAKINNLTSYTSTKFNFNVGNWIMATISRTSVNHCVMELTQPNNDVPSSKDIYTYTGSGLSPGDLIAPWIAINEISGSTYTKHMFVDYVSINLKPTRGN
jgi:hypothetical protein